MVLITEIGEEQFQSWRATQPAPEPAGGGGLDTSQQDQSGNVWDSSIQGYRDKWGNTSSDGVNWSNGYQAASPYQGPSESGQYNEPYFTQAPPPEPAPSPYQGPSESGTYQEPYFQGAGALPEQAAPDWRTVTEDPYQIQRGRQINAVQDWADQQANEPYSGFRQGLINNTLNPDEPNWAQRGLSKIGGGLGAVAGAIDYGNPAIGANAIYQATQGNRSLDLNPSDFLSNLRENRQAAQEDVNPYLYAAGATVPYITATAGLGALGGTGGLLGAAARSGPAQFALNQGSPLAQLGAAEGATFAGRNREDIPGLNRLPDWAAPVIGGIAGFGAGAALNKLAPIAGRSLTSGALSGEQGSVTVPNFRRAKPEVLDALNEAGVTVNPDGTVTLYHGTTVNGAAAIRREGVLRSAGEPDVYVSTIPGGYGPVAVPVKVRVGDLILDDQFPGGRADFRLPSKGGTYRPLETGVHAPVAPALEAPQAAPRPQTPRRPQEVAPPALHKVGDTIFSGGEGPIGKVTEVAGDRMRVSWDGTPPKRWEPATIGTPSPAPIAPLERARQAGQEAIRNGPPAPPRPPRPPTDWHITPFSPLGNAARAVGREVAPATVRAGIGAGAGAVIAEKTGQDWREGAAIGAAGGLGFRALSQGAKYAVEKNLPKTLAEQAPASSNKLMRLIKAAEPVSRKEQAALRKAELSKRVGKLASVQSRGAGTEASFRQQLGTLKGDLPNSSFAPLESHFTPDDLIEMRSHIETSPLLQPLERLSAQTGLLKALAGELPQKGEIVKLGKVFGDDFAAALLSKRAGGVKAWEAFKDAVNIPRTLVTVWDASMPLRQGLIPGLAHPRAAAEATVTMAKAMASPKYAKLVVEGIDKSPNAAIYTKMGIKFISKAEDFAEGLELMPSKYAGKIPGVAGSQRGAAAYMDKLFQNVADGFIAAHPKLTDDELKAFGTLLNLAGGRGYLPQFIKSLHGGLSPFFAPAYAVSRIEYPPMVLKAMAGASGNVVRKEAARQLVAYVGTGVSILALGNKMGVWDVEVNPLSSDFGKGKAGNTRFDFWAGEVQVARYTAQLIAGKRKDSTGRIVETGGPGDSQFQKRLDTLDRWLQSKASPALSTIREVRTGKDFVGNDITPGSLAWNHLVPLFIQDMVDAANDDGNPFKAVPAVFGSGVQTYTDSDYKKRDTYVQANYGGRHYDELEPSERQKVDTEYGKLAPLGERAIRVAELTKQFTEAQLADDAKFMREGTTVPKTPDDGQTWRDQNAERKFALRQRKDEIYAGLPDQKAKDALDKFYAIIDANTIDPTIINGTNWDKVDAAVANLTPNEQGYIDRNTGLGGTPAEQARREVSKKIADTGFFDLKDNLFQAHSSEFPGGAPYTSYYDWRAAIEADWTQKLIASGVSPIEAPAGAASRVSKLKIVKDFEETYATKFVAPWMMENPYTALAAYEWGYSVGDTKEIRAFLGRVRAARDKGGSGQ